jgi:hypothetical protein
MKDPNFNKQSIYNVENFYNHYIIQKNKENRKELFEFLKSQLLNVEFETILVVAQFFEEIYPDQEEDMEFYIDTIDRFCVHLMGYKYTEAYKNKNPRILERITLQVTSLCTIIRLLIIGIKYDFGDNPYHPGIKNLQVLNKPNINDNSFQTIVANSNTKNFNKSPIHQIQHINNLNKPKFSIFSATDNILENLMALDSSYIKKPTLSEIDFMGNATQVVPCNNISEFNALDCDQQEKFLKKVFVTLGNYFNSQAGSNQGNVNNTSNQINSIAMPVLTVNGENVNPINQIINSHLEKNNFSPIQKAKDNNFTNRQFGYDLNISEISPIPNTQIVGNISPTNNKIKSSTENNTILPINTVLQEKNLNLEAEENNLLDYIKNFLEKKAKNNKSTSNSKKKNLEGNVKRKFSVIYTPHIVIDEGNEDIQNESMHKSMKNIGSVSCLHKFRNSLTTLRRDSSLKNDKNFQTISVQKNSLSNLNLVEVESKRKLSIYSENVNSLELNTKRILSPIKRVSSEKNVSSKFTKKIENNQVKIEQINNKQSDSNVSKISEFYRSYEDNNLFSYNNDFQTLHPNLISSDFSDEEIPENNIRTRFANM